VTTDTSPSNPATVQPRRPGYKPGDQLRVTLGAVVNRGMTIAHTPEGQAILVSFGAPGEEVVVEIDRVHKDRITAHVAEILRPSPDRVTPLCPYFMTCGGCNYQHLSYEAQLELKREVVVETLRRIGRFDDAPVLPTMPSPSPWFYRNQARFSTNRWGDVGFTRRMSNHVIRIDTCYIVERPIREAIPRLQGKGAGLHQIVVRSSSASGALMVAPNLSGRGVDLPTGQSALVECVDGQEFYISPAVFFQVNTAQAENMARLVRERLDLRPDDVLADLYAGVGFFSKLLAPLCRTVYAVEISRQAAQDAAHNLAGVENVRYVEGEVERVLPTLPERPTKVLLDPSREGCAPAAVDAMLDAAPERIVYVSCDAATLARDLRRLVDGGYTLREVQPLDMFPQTFHVECVVALARHSAGLTRGQT
jgi:23S rRNA (uracil1939-C5)-methyltransferase